MKIRNVDVLSVDGDEVPALLIMCPNGCANSAFHIFMVEGKHQHLQCTECRESFCDGSCSKGEQTLSHPDCRTLVTD